MRNFNIVNYYSNIIFNISKINKFLIWNYVLLEIIFFTKKHFFIKIFKKTFYISNKLKKLFYLLFKIKLNKKIFKFLKFFLKNNNLIYFKYIYKFYNIFKNNYENVVKINFINTLKISKIYLKLIFYFIKNKLKYKINLNLYYDLNYKLITGYLIKYNKKIIDESIINKLKNFNKFLKI